MGLFRRRRAVRPDMPWRVLVVNDDEGGAELMARLLAADGHTVERALTASQAGALLGVFRPECIVLDLAAGGVGSSLKLLDVIRSHPEAEIADARVVLVASRGHNRMFSWQAGVDAYLERPFHADDLCREVQEALARPEDDRPRHRRRQLDAAALVGRTIATRPADTQQF